MAVFYIPSTSAKAINVIMLYAFRQQWSSDFSKAMYQFVLTVNPLTVSKLNICFTNNQEDKKATITFHELC